MFFLILNVFFQAVIVVLLVRYFIERYRFYGFGPILVAIITITEKLTKPLKQIIPRSALKLQDNAPLFAIAVVVVIRGFALWLLGFGYTNHLMDLHRQSETGLTLIHCVGISVAMAAELFAVLLIGFLFASVMVSKSGITTCASAGFTCFQERTFAIFQQTRRIYPTNNLVILFCIASVITLVLASMVISIASFSFLYGSDMVLAVMVLALFGVMKTLIMVYGLLLLVTIIASWLQVDRLSLTVQLVRSMTDPYLGFFRRVFPWARIEFLDLSPIFAFLFLNPCLTYALFAAEMFLLDTFGI